MIGAIIGDTIGSIYEFDNIKSRDFELFSAESVCTDDSIMTVAVADALASCEGDYSKLEENAKKTLRAYGKRYPFPMGGYGGRFGVWLRDENMGAYNSLGNGSAMRVSPVAYFAKTKDEVKELSNVVTGITHNHAEGLKGAECIAVCTWMALHGSNKADVIRAACEYYPEIKDMTLDNLHDTYYFNETCMETVPQSIVCVRDANTFEEVMRNIMYIGGDTDTMGAIAGALAGALYVIPIGMRNETLKRMPKELRDRYLEIEQMVG